jgi:nucleoside-diphosphate-sugar epimerase
MNRAPKSPYAVQKAAGEFYCRVFHSLYGLKTFALRYFNVFGPRQNPKSQYAAVIPLFARALLAGRAPVIHGTGEQTRDFTFVEDVVSANICCCSAPESAAGEVYNIACGNRISIVELAGVLMKVIGVKVPPEFGPARPGDVRDSQGDSTKARRNLSWKPAWTFEDGIRKTVEFLRASP